MTWLVAAALAAAGLVAANPVQALPPKPRPLLAGTFAPGEIVVHAVAECRVPAGQWVVRWRFRLTGERAWVVAATDHVNGTSVVVLGTSFRGGEAYPTEVVRGSLPGDRTTAGLTAQVQVVGEATPRTVVRTLQLSGGCAAESPSACVTPGQVRYSHTFDGAAGLASVTALDSLPCISQMFLFDSWYWHEPENAFHMVAGDLLPILPGVRRIVASIPPTPPCRSLVAFSIGDGGAVDPAAGVLLPARVLGGPESPGNRSTGDFAGYVRHAGTCLAPAVSARSLCDGTVELTVSNGSAASTQLRGTVRLGSSTSSTIVRWFSVSPGSVVSLRILLPYYDLVTAAESAALNVVRWQHPTNCHRRTPPVPGRSLLRWIA